MTGELPPDIPQAEAATEAEVDAVAALARMAFEAEYQDRVHRFRAGITALFMRQGYEDMQQAWMVFDIEEEGEGSLLEGPRTDLLVATVLAPSPRGPMLHVRMMKNELYRVETGHDCVVTDMTVDNDGDAAYFIDSYPLRDDLPTRRLGDEEVTVSNVLPMFIVKEGKVGWVFSENNRPEFGAYTPIVDANIFEDDDVSGKGLEVFPFGTLEAIEDKSHALSEAEEVLVRISGITPALTSLS